ncbi:hypothetical protein PILCRDRAFT_823708 [Piloderma croceum F 1598]|uniref:Uncharacterized protein n=1 Tax=Piloderma croceum (strain F 1598) TaxID=765440 RepID=A0A0C3FHT4_PILCF|nr:hypothetical protein PILCRDRAFT_823708 [Piloderma croceum F 1598]
MTQMVINTNGLRAAVQEAAKSRGLNLENVSELSSEMATVLEELKAEFPPPEEADHHGQRVEIVSRVLMKIERCVVRVSVQCGMSEADASAHFRNIEPHIKHVMVVTGDLTEQHPILLETLLFSGVIMFIPEVWALRPVLSIFGFGPIRIKTMLICLTSLQGALLGRNAVSGVHLLQKVAGLRACSQPGCSSQLYPLERGAKSSLALE